MSKGEFSKIYSESNYTSVRKVGEQYRDAYRSSIGLVIRKYGICGSIRASHFLGQIAVESYYMMAVREASVAVPVAVRDGHASIIVELNGYLSAPPNLVSYFDRYENTVRLGNTSSGDGVKFRGRGFKQLTGRYNYSEYWIFRGWLSRESYDHAWFGKKPPGDGPVITNPEWVGNDDYSCVDTAGFFCVRYPVEKAADIGISEIASRAVSKIINPFDVNSPLLRWAETQKVYRTLGDKV